jgi:holo-[acyl-carrier protein] synthase
MDEVVRVAVGVDLVEIARVRSLLQEHPGAASEIFTPAELRYCDGKRERLAHLAARFAAKEAVLKALGTGLGPGMRWTDVEVRNDRHGQPRIHLGGRVAERAPGNAQAQVSLSHTRSQALAHVVLLFVGDPTTSPTRPPLDGGHRCGST